MAIKKLNSDNESSHDDGFDFDYSVYNALESKITTKDQQETDNRMRLAKRISTALKAKGWKQIDLSRALNDKDPAIISRWLSGTHSFTIETLWEIENALEIELISLSETDNKYILALNKLTDEINLKDGIIEDYIGKLYEKEYAIKELRRELAILQDRRFVQVLSTSNRAENIIMNETFYLA